MASFGDTASESQLQYSSTNKAEYSNPYLFSLELAFSQQDCFIKFMNYGLLAERRPQTLEYRIGSFIVGPGVQSMRRGLLREICTQRLLWQRVQRVQRNKKLKARLTQKRTSRPINQVTSKIGISWAKDSEIEFQVSQTWQKSEPSCDSHKAQLVSKPIGPE